LVSAFNWLFWWCTK